MNIKNTIEKNIAVKTEMLNTCSEDIQNAANIMVKAIKDGKKIFWCGNGGSAADAQHMAAELMGGLVSHDRKPIASIALTTDTSFITAWANDTDYSSIFSRQIQGLGKPNDVLIAISTSGNSNNIIKAIEIAIMMSMKIIILTGNDGGSMSGTGDVQITIPSDDTQRIQEAHLLVEHILCEFTEDAIINSSN